MLVDKFLFTCNIQAKVSQNVSSVIQNNIELLSTSKRISVILQAIAINLLFEEMLFWNFLFKHCDLYEKNQILQNKEKQRIL